ncbi:MAG: hypothetical protein LRY50_13930 [Geovibrio sp.]|nr:hypothetical protein [Geovibrio sp.]
MIRLTGELMTSFVDFQKIFTISLGIDKINQIIEVNQLISDKCLASVDLNLTEEEISFEGDGYEPETYFLTVRDSGFHITVFISEDEYSISEHFSLDELLRENSEREAV